MDCCMNQLLLPHLSIHQFIYHKLLPSLPFVSIPMLVHPLNLIYFFFPQFRESGASLGSAGDRPPGGGTLLLRVC